MHVVVHQDIVMKLATAAFQGFAQPVAIGVIVVLAEETGCPVMVSLHDVQRQTWEMDARTAGYAVNLAGIRKKSNLESCGIFSVVGGVGRWSVQEWVPTLERGNQVEFTELVFMRVKNTVARGRGPEVGAGRADPAQRAQSGSPV